MNLLAQIGILTGHLFGNAGEPIVITWREQLIFLLRILIAGVLGLIIGFERSRRQKEAGLATHFVVGCAAALFTIISMCLQDIGDGERIAAQVVSGIGFLGAGVIFFRRETLRGLTTAAGIWTTAAIGMCVAIGQIYLALGATAIVIIVQIILHTKFMRRNALHMLFVKFRYNEEIKLKILEFFECESFHRFKITKDGENMVAEAVIYPKHKFYANELSNFMCTNDEILSIERLEDL